MACLRSEQGSYVWVVKCVWRRRVRHVCSGAAAIKSSEALQRFLALPRGMTCVCTTYVSMCHDMCMRNTQRALKSTSAMYRQDALVPNV